MSTHIVIPNESGQVYVAGPNTNGQLSLGTTTQTNTFTFAKLDPSTNMTSVLMAADSSAHSLFLRSTGQVYSCGANANGQLGLGTTTDVSYSRLVQASAGVELSNVAAVAAGSAHSVFLLTDGSALACGLNTSGQLGDVSSNSQKTYPSPILSGTGTAIPKAISSISAGNSHTILGATDGTAWSCGSNANGQIGCGNVIVSSSGLGGQIASVPKALWLSNDTAYMTMDASNRVSQWSDRSGNNRHATQSTYANKPVYDAVSKSLTFNGTSQGFLVDLNFVTNSSHMSFILTKTTLSAGKSRLIYGSINSTSTALQIGFWGANKYRMNLWGNDYFPFVTSNFLLDEFNLVAYLWTPDQRAVYANTLFEASSNSANITPPLGGGGAIGMAGSGFDSGAYYIGSITEMIFLTGANITQSNIDIVNSYMMKIINDNYRAISGFSVPQLYTNYALQAKLNASTNLSGITQVAAGWSHSLALTTSSIVYAWGANAQGQLAMGTTTDTSYASLCLSAAATTLTGISHIAAGAAHSIFLTTAGTAFACGSNSAGQLADGTLVSRSYPVQVLTAAGQPLTNIMAVQATSNQSYFLTVDGTIYAAGFNGTGAFGNGTTTDSSYAVQVLAGSYAYLKMVGYNAEFIKRKGATVANMQSLGFSTIEIFTAGYTKTELAAAGYTIAQLKSIGITYTQMINAGYTSTELLAAGYPNIYILPVNMG